MKFVFFKSFCFLAMVVSATVVNAGPLVCTKYVGEPAFPSTINIPEDLLGEWVTERGMKSIFLRTEGKPRYQLLPNGKMIASSYGGQLARYRCNYTADEVLAQKAQYKFTILADSAVCVNATVDLDGKRRWKRHPNNKKYVEEAKLRGLNCGVGSSNTLQAFNQNPPTTVSEPKTILKTKSNVQNWPDQWVCERATTYGKWDLDAAFKFAVDEAKKRGLTCNVTGTNSALPNEPKIAIPRKTAVASSSQACADLQQRVNNHITKSEYEKAQEAVELMKSLGCGHSGSAAVQQTSPPPAPEPPKPRYSSSELACSVGPLWKPNFGRKTGYFSARSFDDNPRSKCQVASSKCEAYAQAAASGARAPQQFKQPDSYRADCFNYGRSTDCTISPNTGGGGFIGGFADGLNKGLRSLMAKKQALMATFRSCMANEGYSLTER